MSFKHSLRITLNKELDLYFDNEEEDNEPFLVLGYGANAYFEIVESLSKMFMAITLFAIPIFYIYVTGNYYGEKTNFITKSFFGNFGASKMLTKEARFASGHISLRCPGGTVLDTDNAHFGIMSNEHQSFIYVHQNSVQEIVEQKGYHDCDRMVNTRKKILFQEIMKLQCNKKNQC